MDLHCWELTDMSWFTTYFHFLMSTPWCCSSVCFPSKNYLELGMSINFFPSPTLEMDHCAFKTLTTALLIADYFRRNKTAKVSSANAPAVISETSHKSWEHTGCLSDSSVTTVSALLICDMLTNSLDWLLQSECYKRAFVISISFQYVFHSMASSRRKQEIKEKWLALKPYPNANSIWRSKRR